MLERDSRDQRVGDAQSQPSLSKFPLEGSRTICRRPVERVRGVLTQEREDPLPFGRALSVEPHSHGQLESSYRGHDDSNAPCLELARFPERGRMTGSLRMH